MYFLESVFGAYSFSVYAQVSSKFNLENFKSPMVGNINVVTT